MNRWLKIVMAVLCVSGGVTNLSYAGERAKALVIAVDVSGSTTKKERLVFRDLAILALSNPLVKTTLYNCYERISIIPWSSGRTYESIRAERPDIEKYEDWLSRLEVRWPTMNTAGGNDTHPATALQAARVNNRGLQQVMIMYLDDSSFVQPPKEDVLKITAGGGAIYVAIEGTRDISSITQEPPLSLSAHEHVQAFTNAIAAACPSVGM